MKMKLVAAVLVSLLGTAMLSAGDKPTTKPATQASAVNKLCAVEGEGHTVDPEFFIMYKGKKIGFCTEECMKTFETEPETYIARMKKRNDFPK